MNSEGAKIKSSTKQMSFAFIAVLILFLTTNNSAAQTNQMPPMSFPQINMEFMKPDFKEVTGIESLSSIWFINFRVPTRSGKIVFVGDLPFSYYKEDENNIAGGFGAIGYDGFMVGNPLFSIEFESRLTNSNGFGVIGFRPPLAGESSPFSAVYGTFSDFDRFEAFLPNVFSVMIGGGGRFYDTSENPKTVFKLGALGLLTIPTEKMQSDELFVKYYLQMWKYFESANLNFSFTGVALISESGLNLGQRTEHQLGIGTQINLGQISPGAFIRVPIARDLNQIVKFVGGINVTIALGPESKSVQSGSN